MNLIEIRRVVWDSTVVKFWVSLYKAITRKPSLEELPFINPSFDEGFVGIGEEKSKLK